MSRRTALAAALAVGLLSPVALVAPSGAAEPSRTVAPLLATDVTRAVPGQQVTFTVRAPRAFSRLSAKQKRVAKTVLQRKDGGRWRTVASVRARAKVRVSTTAPQRTQVVRYRSRLVVRRTQHAGGSLGLRVVTQRLKVTPSSRDADAAVTYAAEVVPATKGRPVVVERYLDGAWSTVAQGTTSAKGRAGLAVAAVGYPAWYRLTAPAYGGVPAVSSRSVLTTLDRVPSEIAHRAGAAAAPEQTLAAVRAALAAGATSMEVDVQLTSDNQPVIVHDKTFERTTDVEEVFPTRAGDPIASFTLAEIKQLDAGSWFGAQFAGERIPTLDEVVDEMGGSAHLVLEVKDPAVAGNTGIRDVLDTELASGKLGQLNAADRLTVSSFGHSFLKPFAEAHPDVPVGALYFAPPSGTTLAAVATWAEEIHSQNLITTRASTDAVRAAGMTTSVWTLATPAEYRFALAAGSERFITDAPGTLAEVLDPPAPR